MSDSIQAELDGRFIVAMKSRNESELRVIRAIRTKIQAHKTAKNFDGLVDDALYLKIIGSYVKSMKAAIEDFQKGGDRAAEMINGLNFEINYLSEFLPKKLDEAATRVLVDAAIAETKAASPKQLGQVMGFIMKTHRDEVDAGLVRKLIEAALTE